MFDSEPFGQRAVRLGFATSEQVREAVETQKMLAEKAGLIGEILVEMGWLTAEQYIDIVQQIAEEHQGDHDAAQEAFITNARKKHKLDPTHVDLARKIQSGWIRKNKLIGQVMVELGFISAEQLEQIIATYRNDDQGR